MARRARVVICNHPGCRVMTEGRHCSKHKPQLAPRVRDKFLDTTAWRKMSSLKLAETPWCEQCHRETGALVPAEDVDHILPRKTHPHLALEWKNLQSLCLRCHQAKTAKGL